MCPFPYLEKCTFLAACKVSWERDVSHTVGERWPLVPGLPLCLTTSSIRNHGASPPCGHPAFLSITTCTSADSCPSRARQSLSRADPGQRVLPWNWAQDHLSKKFRVLDTESKLSWWASQRGPTDPVLGEEANHRRQRGPSKAQGGTEGPGDSG